MPITTKIVCRWKTLPFYQKQYGHCIGHATKCINTTQLYGMNDIYGDAETQLVIPLSPLDEFGDYVVPYLAGFGINKNIQMCRMYGCTC